MILAAGRATRMGAEKLLLPLGTGTILDAALRACAGYDTVVVGPPAFLELLEEASLVVNDAPERGMLHSLRLADAVLDPSRPLLVLLGDTPLVDAPLVAAVAAALEGVDVAYPERGGTGGHPVGFGPRARALVRASDEEGDGLRRFRDDPSLTRARLPILDDRPYLDVDDPESYRALLARLAAPKSAPGG